jgi:hypothetical protein
MTKEEFNEFIINISTKEYSDYIKKISDEEFEEITKLKGEQLN